jgi:Peptidase family M28
MHNTRVRPGLHTLMPGKPGSMIRSLLIATAAGMIGAGPVNRAQAQSTPRPELERLRAIVTKLASTEMQGRRGEGARKAAGFLIDEFRRLKLEPLFQGQFIQEVPSGEPGRVEGRNVGAVLRGADPRLKDEWVIVSAHYDHLGVRGGIIYPGADDNASGVAMMLEVARSMAAASDPPCRSLMFIGFDLEEIGLFGSRYFVAHPPVRLEQVVLFITADMIGRALGGVCESHVFVLGTEHAPGLRPWIDQAAKNRPLTVGLLGSDLLILNRSDYGPFRSRQIPYLFFTTGENPRYHSPDDRPESLNYAKLAEISQVIHGVTRSVASAPSVPRWRALPDNPLAEAVTIRDVIRKLMENRKALDLGAAQLYLMNNTLHDLDQIIARGTITVAERASVIQAARIVLLMMH